VLAEAVKRNTFAKAMQAPVRPAPDLVERVAGLIDRQVVDLLGLARRSGSLVTGFEKVDVALRTGKVVLLIEAKDAGADGRAKLARHTLPGVEIWTPLTAEQLGRAIGRDYAVHVAVGPGGLATRLKAVLRRQQGLSDLGVAGAQTAPVQPRTEPTE
jgi:ribosomal protein L7Ae-like RNA K-turn-binding protein